MKYDIVIIGGGIVGLATAFKIKNKRSDLNVAVVEKESNLASHQTGHNSGVIHSGIYYKPGSLKATNCTDGYHQLVRFCREEGIPFELCGKIIVATNPKEITYLDLLYARGVQNGLEGLKPLSREQLKEKEPYIEGIKGIWVPQTGIIDYTVVSKKYAEKFEALGGKIFLSHKVIDIKTGLDSSEIVTSKTSIETKLIVNCAGLYSDKIAIKTGQKIDVRIIPFRGEYFKLAPEKAHLIKNLVYPVPDPNFPFLGVHFTRMIGGGVEAGPNAVLAFAREGYKKRIIHLPEFAESIAWPGFLHVMSKYWQTGFGEMYRSISKAAFTKALQKLMPDIEAKDLVPGGAGVRAQACERRGGLIDDFLILENKYAVNVCNAPSPAATSSLAIGDHVAGKALARF